MNALAKDISTVVSLLEYQSLIYGVKRVPVTQEALDKFEITDSSFTFALRQLVKKEKRLKIVSEHIDGDTPTGDNWGVEFFIVSLPTDFVKTIVSKYSMEPVGTGRKMPIESKISEPIISTRSLAIYSNGVLEFHKNKLKIRNQLKELCILFLESDFSIVSIQDIREKVISSEKQKDISDQTISKYVCELRRKFKQLTGKNIIKSVHKEGWRLDLKE